MSSAMYALTRAAIRAAERLEKCRVYLTPAERLALHLTLAHDAIDDAMYDAMH